MKTDREILAEYGGRERGTTAKTVREINAEHGRRAGEILNGYEDAKEAIREQRDPEAGRYLDKLGPEERMRALREQKAEATSEAYKSARASYRRELERYAGEVARRKAELRTRLFGVDDPAAAETLARAATADEEQLRNMLSLAAQTGNRSLAKAVFAAAEQRRLGDVLAEYFVAGVDAEARDLYVDWSELPTEEALERQLESVDRIVQPPDPERLMPPARGTT